MNPLSRDVVQAIASQITDRKTWYNFALVCKQFVEVTRLIVSVQKEIILQNDPLPLVNRCPGCTDTNIITKQVQYRSADEIPTLICECINCRHRWRI